MPDPAIMEFFETRKENWLKNELKKVDDENQRQQIILQADDKFNPNHWIPDAARRAGQIKISTHPCTFSHPSARKNSNGYVTPIISLKESKNDGYVRTGNTNAEKDALGNAASLDVYKFLSLIMIDGRSLIEHIQAETNIAKELLTIQTDTYENLRDGFMAMVNNEESQIITSSKIKQVYFPIEPNKYHLLSILSNSGLIFELRNRIDLLRFSDKQKRLREVKRNNEFSEESFKEIYDTLTIGYGGTKPQNISVLNNQYGGKAKMLLCVPPVLTRREIRFPRNNFFRDSIRYYHIREPLERLHGIFKTGLDSVIPRKNIESGRDNRIEEILDTIILRMAVLRSISYEQYYEKSSKLPEHQKIWLLDSNKNKRDESDEWLNTLCNEISRWIGEAYKRQIKNPVILGTAETSYIEEIIKKNKEALR